MRLHPAVRTVAFGSEPPAGAEAAAVVSFWRAAAPRLWFAKDPTFDRTFGDRFLALHEAAVGGRLASWLATGEGALALVVLLDQFPPNAFRAPRGCTRPTPRPARRRRPPTPPDSTAQSNPR
jgi:uncharacterized protein (DUF924 family)